jgi:hypothetical protein
MVVNEASSNGDRPLLRGSMPSNSNCLSPVGCVYFWATSVKPGLGQRCVEAGCEKTCGSGTCTCRNEGGKGRDGQFIGCAIIYFHQ